jgi:hypothetical protein
LRKPKGQSRIGNTDPTKQTRGSALTFHSALRKLNTEPSIGASHQVLVHLAKQLQRRFLKIEPSETRMACGSHVSLGSILGRSSMKIGNLVPIHLQRWPPQAILVSDWLISKKSSSLKPLCQMNQNLVGSILGRSSINIAQMLPTKFHFIWLRGFRKED